MRVDRDAAAVVGDGDEAVGAELDLDPRGVAGDRLVHGVVDHLGEEVVQPLLVGAADVHARPPADRLQPLQHLDVGGRIGLLGADGALQGRLPAALGRARHRLQPPDLAVEGGEQVLGLAGFLGVFWGPWGTRARIEAAVSHVGAPAGIRDKDGWSQPVRGLPSAPAHII